MLIREAILRDLVSWLQCPVIVSGGFSNAEESKRNHFRKSFYVENNSLLHAVQKWNKCDLSVIDCSHFHWSFCWDMGEIALEYVCVYIFTHTHMYMKLSEALHKAFLVIRAVAKLWLLLLSTVERFSQSENAWGASESDSLCHRYADHGLEGKCICTVSTFSEISSISL